MNLTSLTKNGCLLMVVATLLVTSAAADTPAFTLGTGSGAAPRSFDGTRGWQFGVHTFGPNTIAITQLGIFDSGGDGLLNPHQIGLWRIEGGGSQGALTLLASVTVPAGTGAPLVD